MSLLPVPGCSHTIITFDYRLLSSSHVSQGWRMDPIIIFENLLMTGLLSCWTFEAVRLREELAERQVRKAQPSKALLCEPVSV